MRFLLILILSLTWSCASIAQPNADVLKRWEDIKIQVALISAQEVYLDFSRSMVMFEFSEENPRLRSSFKYKLVEGDADSDISNARTIHILGNLNADVYLNENSNLIIAGNVSASSNIYVDNISAIFVGGSFAGSIHSSSSFNLHIQGNHEGMIKISQAGTKISVGSNFLGKLEPVEGVRISAMIGVAGYTEQRIIDEIYSHDYVTLTGAFQRSNGEPGIHYTDPPRAVWYTIAEQETTPSQ